MGGNHYNNKGGGVNYLCLPSDPQNGKHQPFKNDGLYGAEYQIFKDRQPSGMSLSLGNKEVPCAVCNRKRKSSLLMIPGESFINEIIMTLTGTMWYNKKKVHAGLQIIYIYIKWPFRHSCAWIYKACDHWLGNILTKMKVYLCPLLVISTFWWVLVQLNGWQLFEVFLKIKKKSWNKTKRTFQLWKYNEIILNKTYVH